MAFWNRKELKKPQPQDPTAQLHEIVKKHLAEGDDITVRIVTAVAGLLAGVAYADQDFSDVEEKQLRNELGRIQGLGAGGVDAICGLLRENAAEVSSVHSHTYSRELKELTDQPVRLEVLDVLVDLAAADDDISFAETKFLRQVATSLGLTQSDYNASQARHREKLSVLKKG